MNNRNSNKNFHFLGLFAALTALLAVAGCAHVGHDGAAQARSEMSSGQATVKSPDGTIEMTIHANGALTYSVSVDGRPVLADSKLGLKFKDGMTLGADARLARVERSRTDTTWENRLGKRRIVRDKHNELRAFFVESSGRPFEIVVRAFDDGIGFRYVLPKAPSANNQDFVLEEELTQFSFPGNYLCYAGKNENTGTPGNPVGYVGSQESEYLPMHLDDLPTDQVRMVPLLVRTPAAWVAITESDLYDWAGMWVNRAANAGTTAAVTVAARLSPRPDGQGLVKSDVPASIAVAHAHHRASARPAYRKRSGAQPGLSLRAGGHILCQTRNRFLGLVVPG